MVSASVSVPSGGAALPGDLEILRGARGAVLFAHGSGSSRLSPRNRAVAAALREAGFGTLLLDLLTPEEEREDDATGRHRFDIGLLAGRLAHAVDWLERRADTMDLPVGLFGASTGAAAALVAATRPDLAGDALGLVSCPVLLVVGGDDETVLGLNRRAAGMLTAPHRIHVVPGATHLFPEPGALEQVAALAADWFREHL